MSPPAGLAPYPNLRADRSARGTVNRNPILSQEAKKQEPASAKGWDIRRPLRFFWIALSPDCITEPRRISELRLQSPRWPGPWHSPWPRQQALNPPGP